MTNRCAANSQPTFALFFIPFNFYARWIAQRTTLTPSVVWWYRQTRLRWHSVFVCSCLASLSSLSRSWGWREAPSCHSSNGCHRPVLAGHSTLTGLHWALWLHSSGLQTVLPSLSCANLGGFRSVAAVSYCSCYGLLWMMTHSCTFWVDCLLCYHGLCCCLHYVPETDQDSSCGGTPPRYLSSVHLSCLLHIVTVAISTAKGCFAFKNCHPVTVMKLMDYGLDPYCQDQSRPLSCDFQSYADTFPWETLDCHACDWPILACHLE